MSNPIAMIFHDAYQGRDYWLDFINGKNASMLMIEDVSLLSYLTILLILERKRKIASLSRQLSFTELIK